MTGSGENRARTVRPQLGRQLRVAVEADIAEMHRVRMSVRENILLDASRVQFEHYRLMLNEHGRGWVYEIDGQIVGFAIADLTRNNLWALFVQPGWERRGIGCRLHDAALDWLFDSGSRIIWLSTDPGTRAERFYIANNWQYAGRERNGEARYELALEQWQAAHSRNNVGTARSIVK